MTVVHLLRMVQNGNNWLIEALIIYIHRDYVRREAVRCRQSLHIYRSTMIRSRAYHSPTNVQTHWLAQLWVVLKPPCACWNFVRAFWDILNHVHGSSASKAEEGGVTWNTQKSRPIQRLHWCTGVRVLPGEAPFHQSGLCLLTRHVCQCGGQCNRGSWAKPCWRNGDIQEQSWKLFNESKRVARSVR